MGIFTDGMEEEFKKNQDVEKYNRLRKKGLSPQDIAKVIGVEAARNGFEAQNGWDGHWGSIRYIE